jgi:dTDP-4-dehydrorhamnose reductase
VDRGSARILLTGGSGRLGSELIGLLEGVVFPPRSELDVTLPNTVLAALDRYRPDVVVHAAAFTDVARAEVEREACWRTNVEGTRVVAAAVASRGLRLVHLSTDYVFDGERGGYREDDSLGPPRNYYALSKLVAEELARFAEHHLVIRTSFRGRTWPHPRAFNDMWTSQDYVDVIAPKIALAIRHLGAIEYDTLHIGTERKTMYELARRRLPTVSPATLESAGVNLPRDISLDLTRWQEFEAALAE